MRGRKEGMNEGTKKGRKGGSEGRKEGEKAGGRKVRETSEVWRLVIDRLLLAGHCRR